jgi:hypothetical protein
MFVLLGLGGDWGRDRGNAMDSDSLGYRKLGASSTDVESEAGSCIDRLFSAAGSGIIQIEISGREPK